MGPSGVWDNLTFVPYLSHHPRQATRVKYEHAAGLGLGRPAGCRPADDGRARRPARLAVPLCGPGRHHCHLLIRVLGKPFPKRCPLT